MNFLSSGQNGDVIKSKMQVASIFVLLSCAQTEIAKDKYEPTSYVKVKHPEWSKNALMCQLNTS